MNLDIEMAKECFMREVIHRDSIAESNDMDLRQVAACSVEERGKELRKKLRWYGKTSDDIEWEFNSRMQMIELIKTALHSVDKRLYDYVQETKSSTLRELSYDIGKIKEALSTISVNEKDKQ